MFYPMKYNMKLFLQAHVRVSPLLHDLDYSHIKIFLRDVNSSSSKRIYR